ncbi:unnamed protein product [Oppiella nova]|uniref:ABC transporter domain-containing protein n=1 Tax=Oppiella nova TaxID=334625 RepID=A0A7R9QRG7_9ACAR|nr:unnamed protein product [Oppiella nova]CAG2172259.1 unnamed protein product [Oppiella nova]
MVTKLQLLPEFSIRNAPYPGHFEYKCVVDVCVERNESCRTINGWDLSNCTGNGCLKFIDQISDDMLQKLEGIVDYSVHAQSGHMLWFNISGKPFYCFTLEDQPLSRQCQSENNMIPYEEQCFLPTTIPTTIPTTTEVTTESPILSTTREELTELTESTTPLTQKTTKPPKSNEFLVFLLIMVILFLIVVIIVVFIVVVIVSHKRDNKPNDVVMSGKRKNKKKTRKMEGIPIVAIQSNVRSKVSGVVQAGQLLAIMGASGSGKTTLLNALTARNLSQLSVSGKVLLNGQVVSQQNVASISSYIQQQDLHHQLLTVREHLLFQALLRMDSNLSQNQRIDCVVQVMQKLNLANCSDTFVYAISGGQKKILSIASEILTDPSLVDEPTSGLDSFMAQSIVQTLKTMASEGRTVICTIHQPSSQVFALFQHLLLMADGRVAFMGTTSDAKQFFTSQGLRGIGGKLGHYFGAQPYLLYAIQVSAILMGLVFWGQGSQLNINNINGALNLMAQLNSLCLASVAITVFFSEAPIVSREHLNHTYAVFPYFLAIVSLQI